MMNPKVLQLFAVIVLCAGIVHSQSLKALFDYTKNETAGQADWIIDTHQPVPSPAQSGISQSTSESYWLGGISAWGVDLVKKGFTVHTLTTSYGITYGTNSNQYDLSNYNLFIVCEPQSSLSTAEKQAILAFVRNGGGLMMVADHTLSDRDNNGWDSPKVWNDLGIDTAFGLHFQSTGESDSNISQVATNLSTDPNDSIIHGPAGTVTALSYHNGTTLKLLTANNPAAQGHIWMNSVPRGSTKIVAATSRYGKGKVAGVGDSSPADDGTGQSGNSLYTGWTEVGATDNLVFLNMCLWLVATGQSLPTAVSLVSPAQGRTNVQVPTQFQWNNVSTATNFEFDLSTDAGFSSFFIVDSSLTDTMKSVANMALNTTYYWRVRAKNSNGWGPYSSARNLTTWNTPSAPQLVSPANGTSNQSIPVIFRWNQVSGRSVYQLDLSHSRTFVTIVASDTTVTDTSQSVDSLDLGTMHYWRVRAKNDAGWGQFSATDSFVTWNIPTQVQLVVPADGSVNTSIPVAFRWSVISNAATYQFDLSLSDMFSSIVASDSALSDTTADVDSLDPGTAYYWRVRAKNTAGLGAYSAPRHFSTWALPSQVQLLLPLRDTTMTQAFVTFAWQPVSPVSHYALQVSTDTLFSSVVFSDSLIIDTARTVTHFLPGRYFWRVVARNDAGWGAFSEEWGFTLEVVPSVSGAVNRGWNLVSIPVIADDSRKVSMFPAALSEAFAYNAGYRMQDTLHNGSGYWLKFDSTRVLVLYGEPTTTETVSVRRGWNLIGAVGDTVSTDSITTLPEGLIGSPFYEYKKGYFTTGKLSPMEGYWVKVRGDGSIILNSQTLPKSKFLKTR